MTYDSLDIIPYKLFLKIVQTGNISMLTDDKGLLNNIEALKTIWKKLEEDFEVLDPEKKINKMLKVLIEIEEYTSQYDGLQIAIKALRFDRDLDLENTIREQGFTLTEDNFYNDLDKIEQESEVLIMFIEELEAQLPKYNNKKASNIDEVILGYCMITGLQYTDTNVITVTQLYALKKSFDEKLKAIKDQNTKLKSRKR